MKTIRLFAHSNFLAKFDESVKNMLSNKFNVLPSCQIWGDTYDLCEKYEDEPTDFAIFIMHEFLTDREPQTEWFSRMIHPVVDCAKFTYIILNTFDHNYDYSVADNICIKYVIWSYELSDGVTQIIKEL